MTENAHRHSFRGRATLGAMSWNLPNDGWSSPWGCEDEWIPPDDEWRKRIGLAEDAEAPEDIHAKPDLAEARGSSPARAEEPLGLGQMILRFEKEEPEEDPPPPPVKAPVMLPPRRTPLEAVKAPAPASPPPTVAKPPPAMKTGSAPAEIRVVPRSVGVPKQAARSAPPVPEKPQPPSEDVESVSPPVRKRIPRRSNNYAWGSLISLSLGTLGFTLLAWIYLHDTPRESDEDLRPVMAFDQSPTTQAVKKLRAFLDSIQPPENTALQDQSAWTWDTPSLALLVRSNGTAFDNLRDLLEDYDWHPHHAEWHREDLSQHRSWSYVGLLLQAQSAYLERRGDEEPALVSAIDLAELSRRLQEVWAWPGYMHRAMELHGDAVQLLAELLKTTHLDGATLERFQTEFTQCQPRDEVMKQASAAYYVHEKKLLLGPASGELLDTMPGGQLHQRPGRLFFKMNETLSLFADAFRQLRDEVTRPPYTRLSVSVEPVIRLTTPRFYHPNSSGETYFSDHIEGYLALPQEHSLSKARHGLVSCLFALRRYLAEKRSLPKELRELVPQYLSAVPLDPFSGEALLYDRDRGLVYSVGVNLIEEGGRPTNPPLNDDREPTVSLGVAVAAPVKK
ncbi:hypothetical protein SAMN02745166_04324 [Prosthecobacter debontii]|uniref:Uncharacterized protein n=1 Tax=Prosthecobacter debontii TaxID=48467 RepID=A0A1T4YWS1_9BACT|nr:hypothetical protein [Prosthecobacter debontii]SKB05741.1 hypothetical protein SAMN02745166_04324 [Prosthecobacter debontii]